jgi:hypothetical protein
MDGKNKIHESKLTNAENILKTTAKVADIEITKEDLNKPLSNI